VKVERKPNATQRGVKQNHQVPASTLRRTLVSRVESMMHHSLLSAAASGFSRAFASKVRKMLDITAHRQMHRRSVQVPARALEHQGNGRALRHSYALLSTYVRFLLYQFLDINASRIFVFVVLSRRLLTTDSSSATSLLEPARILKSFSR
jgi:hypothetical protein